MENFVRPRSLRYVLTGFGWLCIGVDIVDIIVLGLPTTVVMVAVAVYILTRPDA